MKCKLFNNNVYLLIIIILMLDFSSSNKIETSFSKLEKSDKSEINSKIKEDGYMTAIIVPSLDSKQTIELKSSSQTQPAVICACQKYVTCPPCGVVITTPVIDCPCAPKPQCPVCPPLSLIHEIAAKKVNINN